jgi:hypothetical protein
MLWARVLFIPGSIQVGIFVGCAVPLFAGLRGVSSHASWNYELL